MSKKNKKLGAKKFSLGRELIRALPIILFACVVPLVVKGHFVVYEAATAPWNAFPMNAYDLFNYYKSGLIISTGFISLIYLYLYACPFKENWKYDWKYKALGIFVLTIVFGAVFSENIHVSLWGMIDRHEGGFVWVSYLINMIYTAYYIKQSENRLWILRGLLFSGMVIGTIGVFQYFGNDLFRQPFFQHFYVSPEQVGKMTFSFEVNHVYATLYNPNYVAQYAAMILPVAIIMIFGDPKVIYKSMWGFFAVEMIICLIGSQGRGGILGLAAASYGFLGLLLIKKINRPKLGMILSVMTIAMVVAGFSVLAMGKIGTVLGDDSSKLTQLKDVKIIQNQVDIKYGNEIIKFKLEEGQIIPLIYDQYGNVIESILQRDGYSIFKDPKLTNLKFGLIQMQDKSYGLNFVVDNDNWVFQKQESGVKYFNKFNTISELKSVEYIGFENSERLGSNRGYIWSRTLPLVMKSPLIGNGADSFGVIFPQNEHVIKQQLYGNNNIIVDKPHNMFLQILVSFGIVGFAALSIIIVSSVKKGFSLFITNEMNDQWVALAIMLGIFGYLGAGLFYDSNVNVSPVFWTLVGLSASNKLESKKKIS